MRTWGVTRRTRGSPCARRARRARTGSAVRPRPATIRRRTNRRMRFPTTTRCMPSPRKGSCACFGGANASSVGSTRGSVGAGPWPSADPTSPWPRATASCASSKGERSPTGARFPGPIEPSSTRRRARRVTRRLPRRRSSPLPASPSPTPSRARSTRAASCSPSRTRTGACFVGTSAHRSTAPHSPFGAFSRTPPPSGGSRRSRPRRPSAGSRRAGRSPRAPPTAASGCGISESATTEPAAATGNIRSIRWVPIRVPGRTRRRR